MAKKIFNLITLYYNEKGVEQVSLFAITGGSLFSAKGQLKKDLYEKGYIFKNATPLETIQKVGYNSKWNDEKILHFTELLKIGLDRGTNISIIQAVLFVYKQMFDPLIYLIYIKLEGGEKLSEVLEMFPNIFNDFYVNIIKSYFDESGNQEEGLNEIISFYKKRLELKAKIISSSMMSIISIIFAIGAAFLLDAVSYPSLKEQYQGFPLPDNIEKIHVIIGFIKEDFFIIILILLLLTQLFKVVNLEKFKIGMGKLALFVPLYGKMIRIDAELLFINMYIAMSKASYLTQSEILKIIGDSMPNPYIKGLIHAIRKDLLNEGKELGDLMENKYRFFSEDIIITFKSDDVEKELKKLKKNYVKMSEGILGKTVSTMAMILMMFSMAFGSFIVVSYMMGSMGVNDIIKKSTEQGL